MKKGLRGEIIKNLNIKAFYEGELDTKLYKWRREGYLIGPCPFDPGKSFSLIINSRNGDYRCRYCKLKHDIFSFYMRLHKVNFRTALNELADMSGVASASNLEEV